jgi:hypothetical protein
MSCLVGVAPIEAIHHKEGVQVPSDLDSRTQKHWTSLLKPVQILNCG